MICYRKLDVNESKWTDKLRNKDVLEILREKPSLVRNITKKQCGRQTVLTHFISEEILEAEKF